ncbi:MAG TPA: hypothetical protein VNZ45_17065 [Bacteroidia bacterium]|jgi:hypothetical protein|nr:hypothetical protein [Bacteroidia bacterium]
MVIKEKSLQLIIDSSKRGFWEEKFVGYKLFLCNNSRQTAYFPAEDSRVYICLQAKDRLGNWKDIEYIPHSWCGNSYHTLYLAKKEYWQFDIPIYQGEIKTQIRASVIYEDNLNGDRKVIYSNPISGSINPGQFWRKMGHHAVDIMDPYNE